jgi:hypothetical protein
MFQCNFFVNAWWWWFHQELMWQSDAAACPRITWYTVGDPEKNRHKWFECWSNYIHLKLCCSILYHVIVFSLSYQSIMSIQRVCKHSVMIPSTIHLTTKVAVHFKFCCCYLAGWRMSCISYTTVCYPASQEQTNHLTALEHQSIHN